MTFDQSSSKIFILSGLIEPAGGMLDWLIVTATKFILINQFWISWLFENLTQRLLHYFDRRATDSLAYLIFVEEHAVHINTKVASFGLAESLEVLGFKVEIAIDRFLPFTTKSKTPKHPFFVKLYLMFPLIWRFMGKQALVVAKKVPS